MSRIHGLIARAMGWSAIAGFLLILCLAIGH